MSAIKNLPMADYLAMPSLSASILRKIITECPRAAWAESWLNTEKEAANSDAMDFGTIAHSIILEGHAGKIAIIDPNDHPAEKTGSIPDGWTNKSIRAARDAARGAGLIPILLGDMDRINAMVASARAYIESLRHSEPAVWAMFQPDGGDSELTVTWQEPGVDARMRPDRISADRRIIGDVKTTERSANPAQWDADHFGAAWYRRGCMAEFGTLPDYLFLVIEQHPPYLCSLVGVDPMGLEIGAQKVNSALQIWRQCVERGVWPGYPARACYPEIKPWEAAQWEEKRAGYEYDYETMFGRKSA